jgi:hypothetical protein
MTNREKQLKTKKYPKTEEYEFNHTALLAFVGMYRYVDDPSSCEGE